MVIIETSVFTKQIQKLLTDEEYQQLQAELINRPDLGLLFQAVVACAKLVGLRKAVANAVVHE